MQLKKLGSLVKDIQTGGNASCGTCGSASRGTCGNVAIVTDENVAKLYLDEAVSSLENEGFTVTTFVVEPGERSKSGEVYLDLLNGFAEIPLTRTDGIVALGGGVVGDLAGFAAATFLRGIKVYQVPTTLLAAVDSSVGGKTAINLKAGKNLAGAFHVPALVLQDSSLLETLPSEVFMDGFAEVIKYGVLADKSLFQLLKDKENVDSNLEDIIARCVEIKREIVAGDLYDTGQRQLLNFGHTIGHTIEILSDFKVSHGYAVAKGMMRITEISYKMGWCNQETLDEVKEILGLYDYDLSIGYSSNEIFSVLKADKKRKGDFIDLVIPKTIGNCVLKRVSMDELAKMLCI